ncbi:precorrin-6Y C5,15-methyltransferase (decarboxylating) subunit CbiT [Clostridium tarantellae]|uniref:Precorrin-6Y C5,15-methyltransferase (Decarboxylating) subunit CbiT n=1 Tax=Clostridium tarantellae TaxID=39493 RepID=A0A6I1MLD7_9CLOT|nr:precorrin-6Y C5,15-methyltransferase (decarboxylating) subunit CbiT [Clostridium tarantellae]MPQ42927.1 precorrin-6Y C5,15-methyltransferase (decarboxylating) subunit CbiT [Clostridium tarantellae]
MEFIKDSEFIRGKCPMTKEDIRLLSVIKMNLKEEHKVLDIGSGTGSISIQISKMVSKGIVYSIEKNEEAFNITNKNIEKFNCKNIKAIKGDAVEVLNNLIKEDIKFNSIFVGGSGGNVEEILKLCNLLLEEKGTLVMNFITLNNAYKSIEYMKSLKYTVDITMVNISKNSNESYMMIANNPIIIIECVRREN